MQYLITVPQIARSKRNKVYNLNNTIIEVQIVENYPNGTSVAKDEKGKEYHIHSYSIDSDKSLDYVSDTWSGKTEYLLYSDREEAQEMNIKLLQRIADNYHLMMNELTSKVQEINTIINN